MADNTARGLAINAIKSSPKKTSDLINDSDFITPSTIPISSDSVLGCVKIGNGLNIDENGKLNVIASGGYYSFNFLGNNNGVSGSGVYL